MRSQTKVLVALSLSMIFWSFSYVWVKQAFESFLPLTTITLRLILSTIILSLLLLLTRKFQPIAKEDRKWFVLMAFLEPFLYYIGEGYGLQKVTPTVAAVIIATIPLFTPVLAHILFDEKLRIINIGGIIVSFCGVGFIVFEQQNGASTSAQGIGLMFFAVISALFYGVMVRKLSGKYSPLTIVTFQNGIGIFFFLPFFLFFEGQYLIQTPPSTKAIGAIILLAIFASSLAFILFAYGIQQIGLSRANVFTNAIPAATAVIAWFMLNEHLSAQKITGILIVISGLYISQIKTGKNVI